MALNIQLPEPSIEDHLSTLCDLLESGERIEGVVASVAVSAIRGALENGGKLDLQKKSGRKKNDYVSYNRALAVALIRAEAPGTTVVNAARKIAIPGGVKTDTVIKDYKKHGAFARNMANFIANFPKWKRLSDELTELLLTFRHDNGTMFTNSDVNELMRVIPAYRGHFFVKQIKQGGIRRDEGFLRKILSSL